MRALVTGSAGSIGYHLSRRLLELGFEITIVDNLSKTGMDDAYRDLCSTPLVNAFELDLTKREEVAKLPADFDVVFHLAATNGTQNFYDVPWTVLVNSTLPTLFVLEHLNNHRSKARFVYAGSSEAYASSVSNFDWEVPTAEDVPLGIGDVLNPRWSYGGSKLHGELACVAASSQLGIDFTICRFHNVYGPRMGDKHFIPDFAHRVLAGELSLFGWEDTRTFIYVEDAVDTLIKIALSGKSRNSVVNLGGYEEISILEAARLIQQMLGVAGDIQLLPSPQGSVSRRAPNLQRLREIVPDFNVRPLRIGLVPTLNWIQREAL